MDPSMTLSLPIATAADDLIAALLRAEPIIAYRQANTATAADEATQKLLKDLTEMQMEFRQRQANGTLTQDHISQLRQLQQQVQADPHVVASVMAQFSARALLDELTEELSYRLGFDFSSLANVSSC